MLTDIADEENGKKHFETKDTELNKKSVFENSNFLSKYMFSWAYHVFEPARQRQLPIEDLGTLPERFKLEKPLAAFKNNWEKETNKGSNTLLKCIIKTFQKEYFFCLTLSVIEVSLRILAPFLIKWLVEFIKDSEAERNYGLMLVATLAIS